MPPRQLFLQFPLRHSSAELLVHEALVLLRRPTQHPREWRVSFCISSSYSSPCGGCSCTIRMDAAKNVRMWQKADADGIRVANQHCFPLISCLPMAPVLPSYGNGDFEHVAALWAALREAKSA